jgi:acetyl-CoA carboxylase biotin carboxyl carrier protein
MQLAQIKALIDAMASSDLTELEVSEDGWTLRLARRQGQRAPARPVADPQPELRSPRETGFDAASPAPIATSEIVAREIIAPLAGIVYLRPSPGQPPYVVAGQAIKAGTAVCIIEAMKTMNEIRAEQDGTIEAILVASETLVEAGQPLMRIT